MCINKFNLGMLVKFIIIICFFMMLSDVMAATYYVDYSNGDDANNGTSTDSPWKTITKVNASSFSAGDNILFKKGETWSEQLTIKYSGSSGNPIVYSSYGSGSKPIIDGNNTANYGIYASNKSYITIDGFNIKKMKKTGTSYAIYFTGGTYNTVKNCDISEVYYVTNPNPGTTTWEAQYGVGIQFIKCNGATISGNTIKDCGSSAILYGTQDNISLTNLCEIFNNEITNVNIGIRVTSGNTSGVSINNVKIHNNYIHDFNAYYYCTNWHRDGIHVWSTSGLLETSVENVEIYNNFFDDTLNTTVGSTAWLYIEYNCKNFKIHHNIFSHCPAINSIRIKGQTPGTEGGHEIYNNTIYSILDSNNGTGLTVTYSDNIKVKNNIFYVQKFAYTFDTYSATGVEINNNLLYRVLGSGDIASINGFMTFAELNSAGYEAHGMISEPLFDGNIFTGVGNTELFKLQSNSQAIDKGANLGFTSDFAGNPIPQGGAPDIGAFEYQSGVAPPPPSPVPTINSTTINPSTGNAKIGSAISITVTAGNNQTGLTPSTATINGKQITLSDQGNGTYTGTYTVAEGDNDGVNIEATNITLTGAGGTSTASSSAGSTLKVDAHKPAISSTLLTPNTGWLKSGSSVLITVTAVNNETGLTASNTSINGKSIPLTSQGNGTYVGTYTVQTGDAQGVNIEATAVTLTDAAGNVSSSGASTGSTLKVDTSAPAITLVTINPITGTITTGASVTITATAANNEAGLTVSNALINGKSIVLAGQGNGTYTGTYTVQAADAQGVNIEATGITLTDAAGNVSSAGASTGSTLKIATNIPSISTVTINPNTGNAKISSSIAITVTAANNQTGLTPSAATINGKQIALSGQGNGTYTGTYTVAEGDNDGVNVEATNITLTGAGGTSAAASSTGSTLKIDAHKPTISSTVISPNTGWLKSGSSVLITVTAGNNESGLTVSNASINGKSIPLTGQGNGTYKGTYTVQAADAQGVNIEATGITLTDTAGNASTPGASTGSTLKVDTVAPVISLVTINPITGTITTGTSVTITATAANNEVGLTSSNTQINGKSIALTGQGNGTYSGTYTVQAADAQGVNIEATGIILTDAAGNVSASGASTGSTLKVNTLITPPATAPIISSAAINPTTGNAKIGSSIAITVTAGNNQTGLTPSNATINGKQIVLTGQGNGTYTGTYTVAEGDNDGVNVEATNITLTGTGGTSTAASSTGSTLKVDAHKPTIVSTSLSPNTGWLKTGSSVIITVTAGNNESGLTASNASINGKSIPLTGQGNGVYRGTYTVQTADAQGVNIEATGITLTDVAGNASAPGASTGSTLKVDTASPVISLVTVNPNTGTIAAGTSVTITATAANNEIGLTASNAQINGKSVVLTGQGNGTYSGTYTVQAADAQGVNIEATGITLTDAAGNVSAAAASTGSTLKVNTLITPPASAPVISSVAISPTTGNAKIGSSIAITVTAGNNQTGLTPSTATINGKQITLTDQGNGTYTGTYIVAEGDNDGVNVEATNITLTGTDGTSAPVSSTGSTLKVDAHKPTISSTILSPNTGWLKLGSSVIITVTAGNNETGLTSSNATINGKSIPLTSQGSGTYRGTYTVQSGDAQGVNIEATGITLTDAAGNVSTIGYSTGSTLKVDTTAPAISLVTVNPNTGTIAAGTSVTITATAANNEIGLTASNAQINGKSIALSGQGNGTYSGTYTVQAADAQGVNIEATGVTLTDAAGNASAAGASTGSTLKVNTQATPLATAPVISSVAISPTTGNAKIGSSIAITVTAGNNQTGLTPSTATINGKQITLSGQGNGTYTGTYIVAEGDNDGVNVEATNITLTGTGGNKYNCIIYRFHA